MKKLYALSTLFIFFINFSSLYAETISKQVVKTKTTISVRKPSQTQSILSPDTPSCKICEEFSQIQKEMDSTVLEVSQRKAYELKLMNLFSNASHKIVDLFNSDPILITEEVLTSITLFLIKNNARDGGLFMLGTISEKLSKEKFNLFKEKISKHSKSLLKEAIITKKENEEFINSITIVESEFTNGNG